MSHAPTVLAVMTPFPVHTSADTSLIAAHSLMKGHDVRHLPVERGGRIVGVVSEADLRTASALLDTPELPLARLCTRPPLVVEIHDPIKRVVAQMAEEGVDAAVVLRQGRLAGIVTLTDICDELIRQLPGPGPTLPSPSPPAPGGGQAA